jgi:hypothetical protein
MSKPGHNFEQAKLNLSAKNYVRKNPSYLGPSAKEIVSMIETRDPHVGEPAIHALAKSEQNLRQNCTDQVFGQLQKDIHNGYKK